MYKRLLDNISLNSYTLPRIMPAIVEVQGPFGSAPGIYEMPSEAERRASKQ